MKALLSVLLFLSILSPVAHGALGTNLDRVTVGTYLYPYEDDLPFGSSTKKWAAWLSSINGSDIDDLLLPDGGSSTDYLKGPGTWATLDTDAVPEGSNEYFTNARTRAALGVTGSSLGYDATNGLFSCLLADGSSAGCLSSSDWNTFNDKAGSIGTFGSSPNDYGASLSSGELTLQPGSSTKPGGVSTTAQGFSGEKTFHNGITLFPMATPTPPLPGQGVQVYSKSDKKVYTQDSDGSEIELGAGASTNGLFADISGGDSSATYGEFHCEIFTSTGTNTLTVNSSGPVKFLLVGGGGGGGNGGGGGGGVLDHAEEDVMLKAGSYDVVVGAGGSYGNPGTDGGDSTFAGFTAVGGGAGGSYGASACDSSKNGNAGGGGGGGGTSTDPADCTGGAGTYGNGGRFVEVGGSGGAGDATFGGSGYWGGGGGGACEDGGPVFGGGTGGPGGDGCRSNISGTATYYGGGGAGSLGNSGGGCTGSAGTGGQGGGANSSSCAGVNASANTGGGGAGASLSTTTQTAGNGGSGYAVICARQAP